METLPKFGVSRADMMKRVARFKDLKGSDGGLPDSKAPHSERTLYYIMSSAFNRPMTKTVPSSRRSATMRRGCRPFRFPRVSVSVIAAPSRARPDDA
jgi:hypothetical protein